jgi:serine protease
MKSARLLAALLVPLFLFAVPVRSAERQEPRRAAPPPASAEVIVRFKADASLMRRHALAAGEQSARVAGVLAQRARGLGERVGHTLEAGAAVSERTQVVRAAGVSAAALAAQLAADPDVEFAVPNGRKRALTAPNDPLYAATAPGVRPNGPDAGQWYLRAPTATEVSGIDIEAAWARSIGSNAIVVAVLDTGVRFDHPDLVGRLLRGYDFVSDVGDANDDDGRDADPSDPGDWITAAENASGPYSGCGVSASSWHGTSTTSLIAAATGNGIGMAGAAPGVRVLPLRVLGKCGGWDSDIQAAMRWAAGIAVPGVPANPNPARVINLSLGGEGACSASYQAVVDELIAQGVMVVAAAGNTTGLAVNSPANCRGVIGVLALRHAGTKVGFSDLGPEITIAAPGGNCVNIGENEPCLYPIVTASNAGTQGPAASIYTDSVNASYGTSFSAPLVAGTAGLMLSVRPALSPSQLTALLQGSARPFPTSGADNGGEPVPQCRPPDGSVQLQCYCTTSTCGAGMLDAGAAVVAAAAYVAPPSAVITASSSSPVAGESITLSAAGSAASDGRVITGYRWQITAGGTLASFSGPTDTETATLLASAAGSVTVQLSVTDSGGNSGSQSVTLTVQPAPSGGGGALSLVWTLLLALAVAALARREPARAAGPG